MSVGQGLVCSKYKSKEIIILLYSSWLLYIFEDLIVNSWCDIQI
jgi:hypothetical protein